LKLSSTHHATISYIIEMPYQQYGWASDVLLAWKHGVHVLGWLLNLEKCFCDTVKDDCSVFPCSPTGDWYRLLHGSNAVFWFVLWGLWVMLKPGLGA
jgi:hypothetical protein